MKKCGFLFCFLPCVLLTGCVGEATIAIPPEIPDGTASETPPSSDANGVESQPKDTNDASDSTDAVDATANETDAADADGLGDVSDVGPNADSADADGTTQDVAPLDATSDSLLTDSSFTDAPTTDSTFTDSQEDVRADGTNDASDVFDVLVDAVSDAVVDVLTDTAFDVLLDASSDAPTTRPLALVVAGKTTQYGNQGEGGPKACPAGQAMIGVNAAPTYGWWEGVLSAFRIYCGSMNTPNDDLATTVSVTTGNAMPSPTTYYTTNSSFGSGAKLLCPANQVMVGFSGAAGPMSKLTIRCASITRSGTTFTTGTPANSGTVGSVLNGAKFKTTDFPATDCPVGQVATGHIGFTGEILDSFSLQCSTIQLGP